ncbi:MAG: hypothetical protein AAB414_03445 [Patescibacteria group bacterium]
MSEQQELRPSLNEIVDQAKANFWSKDRVEREDNLFESYNYLMAADDAVVQSNIDAVAQLPFVIRQTKIRANDIEWSDFCDSLENDLNWESFCRHIIEEITAQELLSDPMVAVEEQRRYDTENEI